MRKAYKFLAFAAGIAIVIVTLTSGISKEYSGGGYKDLVEELYDQAVKQNDNLKSIEDGIDKFEKKKEEALAKYNSFTSYNYRYYNDAKAKATTITDATTKQKAIDIISKSEIRYNNKLTEWKLAIAALNTRETELNDLHALLKITITEQMIDKYQTTELPDNSKLKEATNDLPGLIQKIKAITN